MRGIRTGGIALIAIALLAASPPPNVQETSRPAVAVIDGPNITTPIATTLHATAADVGVVRVASTVTARWEALSATREDFTVCLQPVAVQDTLQVDLANPSTDCSSGSARSSYRPTCNATQSDAESFAASTEQLRFTICAPAKAFLMLRNSLRGPATVPPRRGA